MLTNLYKIIGVDEDGRQFETYTQTKTNNMKSYSQNLEDLIILNHLKSIGITDGIVLECGSNDGLTLSNSRLLIEHGFSACLIEPSSVFKQLNEIYLTNMNVQCLNVAIGDKAGKMKFWESENHVPNGTDKALVSTLDFEETKRWPNVKFNEIEVDVITFSDLMAKFENPKFDVISLDCENYDKIILEQIDLTAIGCKVLVIEWNSIPELAKTFTDYVAKFGMREIHRNLENQIFAL